MESDDDRANINEQIKTMAINQLEITALSTFENNQHFNKRSQEFLKQLMNNKSY